MLSVSGRLVERYHVASVLYYGEANEAKDRKPKTWRGGRSQRPVTKM